MPSRAAEWVAGYIRAWETNDPADIAALFSDDAEYLTAPDATPRRGRDAIVAGWLEDRDESGTWAFDWKILHETLELALIQGRTEYPADRDYLNLWIIRFGDDGRAREFTEWYMPRPHRA
ncbi:nuclear transport factor 2 family protein [Agromyces intestinalis]|uniref:Nuclear transport factor 2 family protein n=1 Tax=Agromyces intestinalis TaxID=2592652 RepID=A0A5C1YFY5_9MICO|nr:nuclear transport factor 2 family protein [Agromyces intestinalis]QEO13692.1 nuclear transport factor 2 family protein [Agromyces intestinalis]